MLAKQNHLNLVLLSIVGLSIVLGCASNKEADKWREKELKGQETRADFVKRSEEFMKYTAPVKLVDEPYVKAPVVIVWKWADGKSEILENNINRIKDHAQAAEDAKSVFRIICSEISAGKYVFNDGGKAEVPAFTTKCETELFDKSFVLSKN